MDEIDAHRSQYRTMLLIRRFQERALELRAELASGIVGGGVPVAAGAALSAQLEGEGRVVVGFLGDGAMGAGVVHETLSIASVQGLPLVLVCENNGYQAATRSEHVLPSTDLARIAAAHGLATETVDGNDVVAVGRHAATAVARARAGTPSFVEMKTYLTSVHLQFDEPSDEHRPEDEVRAWRARDPLTIAHAALMHDGCDADLLAAERTGVDAEIEAAVAAAEAAAWPSAGEVLQGRLAGAAR